MKKTFCIRKHASAVSIAVSLVNLPGCFILAGYRAKSQPPTIVDEWIIRRDPVRQMIRPTGSGMLKVRAGKLSSEVLEFHLAMERLCEEVQVVRGLAERKVIRRQLDPAVAALSAVGYVLVGGIFTAAGADIYKNPEQNVDPGETVAQTKSSGKGMLIFGLSTLAVGFGLDLPLSLGIVPGRKVSREQHSLEVERTVTAVFPCEYHEFGDEKVRLRFASPRASFEENGTASSEGVVRFRIGQDGRLAVLEGGDIHVTLGSGISASLEWVRGKWEWAAPPIEMGVRRTVHPGSLAHEIDTFPPVGLEPSDHRFALVIGVESYQHLPTADFASHDAEVVRDYLTVGLGFPADNVIVLRDAQATKTTMMKYLDEWLPRNTDAKSRVLVFFAGHGAPDPASGDAFLVPFDGDPSYLQTTGLKLKDFYASLEKLPAKDVIVLADACFSGAGGRSVLAKGARPLVTQVDSALSPGSKIMAIAASSGSEITASYEEKGHGLFTYFLLKGLRGDADKDGDGWVTLGEAYDYLKPNVQKMARRQNREQTPQLLPGAETLAAKYNFRLSKVK